jgi:WD40 repeat protein
MSYHGIALSGDGARVAFTAGAKVHAPAWQATSLVPWSSGDGSVPMSLALSADGRVGAVGFSKGFLTVLEVADGDWKLLWQATPSNLQVAAVAFSRDGKRLVAVTADKQVKAYDPASGAEVHASKILGGTVDDVAIAHDGRHVLVATDSQKIWLWEIDQKTFVRLTPKEPVTTFCYTWCVALSGDGRLAAAARHRTPGPMFDQATEAPPSIDVWDCPAGASGAVPAARTLTAKGPVRLLAISAEGDRLLSVTKSGELELWDPRTGEALGSPGAHAGAIGVSLSTDGRRALSVADSSVKGWHLAEGERREEWTWSQAKEPEAPKPSSKPAKARKPKKST